MPASLNKTYLKREKDQLQLYQQYLPSLDLKRQQILLERKKAKEQAAKTAEELDSLYHEAEGWLPFLADTRIDAAKMVTVTEFRVSDENVLGLVLPQFVAVKTEVADYSRLSTPLWFDSLIALLVATAERTLRLDVEKRRLAILDDALQTITKRVNLFDRVLIPETKDNIHRIAVALSDMERTGVIRAKQAKNKKLAGEQHLGNR